MANYYFLGTLLPELRLDEPPEIGFREYEQLLKENLTEKDLSRTRIIRNLFDILNLRLYWKGEPLDPLGNLDESGFEEALATRSMLPPYFFDFIDKHESPEERIRCFPELLATFFREEIRRATGFFKQYFILERELRLVLAAFRAKKLNRDILPDLQYEDPEDPFVAQILAQKDAPDYEPPEKYEELKSVFDKYSGKPLELQKAMFEFRIQKVEEMLGLEQFSADRILAYLVELMLVEKWQHLDKQKGIEIVDSMLKEIV